MSSSANPCASRRCRALPRVIVLVNFLFLRYRASQIVFEKLSIIIGQNTANGIQKGPSRKKKKIQKGPRGQPGTREHRIRLVEAQKPY